MNIKILLMTALLPGMVILPGCGGKKRTSADFGHLKIGMTKEQVREVLGTPDEVRGSAIDRSGNVTSVWSYDVYRKGINHE